MSSLTPKYDTCSSASNPCPNARLTSAYNVQDECFSKCQLHDYNKNAYDCIARCLVDSELR